jgi:hypothetical protein
MTAVLDIALFIIIVGLPVVAALAAWLLFGK